MIENRIDLLQEMADNRWRLDIQALPNIFALGSCDRHVTIRTQQQRAFNLAYMFAKRKHTRVGIVGCGASGATLAVALSRLNVSSSIVDSDPFSRFRTASHRWVHPHIFEWPIQPALVDHLQELDPVLAEHGQELWIRRRTAFPAMNWRAGAASLVAARLHYKFLEEIEQSRRQGDRGSIELIDAKASGFRQEDGKGVIVLDSARDLRNFDAIVLAVGFGAERTKPGFWDPDYFGSIRSGEKVRIVGTGDGGIADALRCSIRGFSYSAIVPMLSDLSGATLQTLLDTETPRFLQSSKALTQRYNERIPIDGRLMEWMRDRAIWNERGNPDTVMPVLQYLSKVEDGTEGFVSNASPLHRYLLRHAVAANVLAVRSVTVPFKLQASATVNDNGVVQGDDEVTLRIQRAGAVMPQVSKSFDDPVNVALRVKRREVSDAFNSADKLYFSPTADPLRWPIYKRDEYPDREDESGREVGRFTTSFIHA